eukprot:TRINITY_DN3417_c0_g1_i1.p1 TRINITY_DN3417_c0_g1~~TRINITY_DN3417_c0_g1_i1.p1  ORF type:complete len:241 (+),score=60.10 TRINITY_DN3417_c0_g1_i1:445-1167(+)
MDTFNPRYAFQVLYDFEGSKANELTVSTGEVLLSQETPTKGDDWIFVVKFIDQEERGFVPVGFVELLSEVDARRYLESWSDIEGKQYSNSQTPSHNRSPTPNYSPSPSPSSSRFFSSSHYSRYPDLSTHSPDMVSPPPFHSLSQNPNSIPNSSSAAILELFTKHEKNLQQTLRQREEKFQDLEQSINNTAREIERYKELNDGLFQKILKLEATLESEHTRLRQRIADEERRSSLLSGNAQ